MPRQVLRSLIRVKEDPEGQSMTAMRMPKKWPKWPPELHKGKKKKKKIDECWKKNHPEQQQRVRRLPALLLELKAS